MGVTIPTSGVQAFRWFRLTGKLGAEPVVIRRLPPCPLRDRARTEPGPGTGAFPELTAGVVVTTGPAPG